MTQKNGLSRRLFHRWPLVQAGRRRGVLPPLESLESRTYFSAVSFAAHVDHADGPSPVAIVVADFNMDGKLDIATADSSTQKVNLFLGDGVGGFAAGTTLSLTAPPTEILSGDFNGDGRPDIAVAGTSTNGSGATTVTVFLNSAVAGSFASGQVSTVQSGLGAGEPIAIAAGDFNGDSHLDIAATNFSSGNVSVLLGTGIGTFQVPVTYGTATNPVAITTGDYNGDGKLDLAVVGSRSATPIVNLLTGSAAGIFTGGADITLNSAGASITTADLNGDNVPDLVVGTSGNSAMVLGNNGQAQFTSAGSVSLPASASDVAVADFNFDGTVDIAAANGGVPTSASSITIGTGGGGGAFTTIADFATGAPPAQIAVGDFNGDSKPDIATANPSTGTFSILLNSTVGTVTQPTTTTLGSDSSSVPFDGNVHLTSIVAGPAGSTNPTGNVQFFDGTTLIGTSGIAAGANVATLDITSLPVGNHKIKAVYQGDSAFKTSTSAILLETITPTPGNGPDLSVAFASTTLPSAFVSGEKATVKFSVTNIGNSLAKGLISNALFLSLDDTFDGTDIPVTITGSLAKTSVNLIPTKSVVLTGSFVVPAGIALSAYHLLANINTTGSLLESDATQELNNSADSPATFSAVTQFGTVGGRKNVVLTLPDADGTIVTYKLSGPGTGTISSDVNGLTLSIADTTLASTLAITGKGGDGLAELFAMDAASALGSFSSATAEVTNSIVLSGGIRKLNLLHAGPAHLDIGAGPVSTIHLGTVQTLDMNSASGIQSLSFVAVQQIVVGFNSQTAVSNAHITAPWIGSLISRGMFAADLTLTGAGSPGGVALRSATVQSIPTSNWSIAGDVGKLSVAAPVAAAVQGFSASITGNLRSFTDTADFNGNIAAASFGTVSIRGNLQGDILAGANFGADGVLGGGDDTFAAGSINAVRVGGAVTGSVIAAGLDLVDDILLNGNDVLLPGGVIKSLLVTGIADPASRFLAAGLPVKAKVGGVAVVTAADPRFQL